MTTINATTPVSQTQSPASFDITAAIEQHLPLVDKVAGTAYWRWNRMFDRDDLVGYGRLGLVKAAQKYASLKYDIRQAIDFAAFAKTRIWWMINKGRSTMSTIHYSQYRQVKRGTMAMPTFVHEGEEYSLSESLYARPDDSLEAGERAEALAMSDWLAQQNPLYAQVVDLHLQGLTIQQVAAQIGRSVGATTSLYNRAINLLRKNYNPAAYVPDNSTARHQRLNMAKFRSCQG
jgi:RNA polymerase sigma factor (sigma-70 family)